MFVFSLIAATLVKKKICIRTNPKPKQMKILELKSLIIEKKTKTFAFFLLFIFFERIGILNIWGGGKEKLMEKFIEKNGLGKKINGEKWSGENEERNEKNV
ncbi:hypothetical protein RFI_34618 [Reticulomyxa filosa]|uniref:Uncharacterized protein n=1 Tax=Reticulomyxa filosa TaxID=46433 RepID=X6LPX8_RETFI|nr:hypothetical protein RFI_34618 [Reticulomyxa filosa]|eukprot:ETO02795.1 hypothetical protein RFI_34618 [Reticulomyxa filosa]